MTNLAIIIPARREAQRFPGKILHPILGTPLILWVVKGASESESAERVIVATDDEEILRTVRDAGYEAQMTRTDHKSGTDRVWEIAEKLDVDRVMNVQGDEPLIRGDILDRFVNKALDDISGKEKVEMATLTRPLDPSEAIEPNRVKVVTDLEGNALYFSRSSIPYIRGKPGHVELPGSSPVYKLHIGVYLYRRDILGRLVNLEQSPLEKLERLEQLRALENGIKIKCVQTDGEFMGVDSLSDVPRVEAILRAREIIGG